ncbi:hypothetical protein EDD21DRAFT_434000, partial [Dissophora ornata]
MQDKGRWRKGLKYLIGTSPHKSVFQGGNFIELDKSLSELLNEDWTVRLELRFACPRMLAGCILLYTSNGHAVAAKCVESYGRKKQVHVHHEPFRIKKGALSETSLPPHGTMYYNVWPLTLNTIDGERLVLGTKSFHVLVTSSIKLDKVDPLSLGRTTTSFTLKEPRSSHATKIFLDDNSVDEALAIAKDKGVCRTFREDALEQMRQLRSKFDSAATYFLCRSSSSLASNHTMMPYTVFTLANCEILQRGSGYAAAVLFNSIATNILRHGDKEELKRK